MENQSQEFWGYQALWRAVILQAILDARTISRKRRKRKLKTKAELWIFQDEENFPLVCSLAAYDVDWIRRKLREAFQSNYQWRKETNKFLKDKTDI